MGEERKERIPHSPSKKVFIVFSFGSVLTNQGLRGYPESPLRCPRLAPWVASSNTI